MPNGLSGPSGKSTVEEGPSNAKPKSTTKSGNTRLLRVLPARFVGITSTNSVSELIAFVSPVTFDALFGSEKRKEQEESYTCYQARFRRLLGPVDPTFDPNSTPSNQAPSARVLKAGSTEKEKENEQANAQGPPGSGEVYIGCSPDIIDRHIAFAALTEGIEEWDTVRYAFVLVLLWFI